MKEKFLIALCPYVLGSHVKTQRLRFGEVIVCLKMNGDNKTFNYFLLFHNLTIFQRKHGNF